MNRDYETLDPRGRWQINDKTQTYNYFNEKLPVYEFLERLNIDKDDLDKQIYTQLKRIGYTSLNGQIRPEEKRNVHTIEFGNVTLEVIVRDTQVSEVRERKRIKHGFPRVKLRRFNVF